MRILSHYVSAYLHIHFLTQWKITNAFFVDAKFSTECSSFAILKRYVSAEFKKYCRSDSAYRLRFRPESPYKQQFLLFSFGGLFFVQNYNILLLERQCNSFHALLFPALSGVEMKMYERSSQAVFFFSHPSHWCLLSCAALT